MIRACRCWLAWTAAVMVACPGCGSEDDSTSNRLNGDVGPVGGSGGAGVVDGGSGNAGTGGTSSQAEVCDGLDNDSNGTVDEGCSCTEGQLQDCYLMPTQPPAGCEFGSQTCTGSTWGPCTGLTLPAPGEDSCCGEFGSDPTFKVYDAFLAAYPPANMPKSIDAVQSFAPQAGAYMMKWSLVKPGQEFVDVTNGGVIAANIEAGRDFSRAEAQKNIPDGASIVATKEEPVIIEKLTGNAPCDGVGWAWGSLLYQMPDFSMGEMAYLYVGYCAQIPNADTEAFFYSEDPVVVCSAPIVK